MAHTLESVLKQLGEEAQVTGGTVLVYREKHVVVGQINNKTGVFTLTDAGTKLLEETPAPAVEEPAAEDRPRRGRRAAAEEVEE